MDKVGSSLLGTKTVGEKPSVFKSKSLKMMLDRQVPSKVGGKKLDDGEGESGVALPSAATLFGDSAESLPSVDSQVIVRLEKTHPVMPMNLIRFTNFQSESIFSSSNALNIVT